MSNRRADIQGLRAVAVLMVVAYHAGLPVPGGFVGVDMFFVISGFVITGMLQREWVASGQIRFAAFYWRRFKRLTPALALMVGTVCVLGSMLLSPFGVQQATAKTALGALTLSANLVIAKTTGGYFDAPAAANPLLNTWSLSVEEQFYLVFPAVIAFGWWLAARSRSLRVAPVVFIAGIGAGSLALTLLGTSSIPFFSRANLFGFYSPIPRAWEFAAGALLALCLQSRSRLGGRRTLVVAGTSGALLVVLSAALINDGTTFPGLWTLLPVTGALLLLAAGAEPDAWTTRFLTTSPMVKAGDWSYSIYLWHWPFIVIATALLPSYWIVPVIAAFASSAPAVASYRWVEQPIRTLTGLSVGRITRLAAACVVLPLLLAGALGATAKMFWLPRYESGAIPVANQGDIGHDEFHGYVQAHFFPCTPKQIRDHALYWDGFLRCQQSKARSKVDMVLVGDSHAEHLFLGLAEALPGTNIAYYIQSAPPLLTAGADMDRIIRFVAASKHIRTVIVGNQWAARGVDPAQLARTLRVFRDSGKAVFVTDDVPGFAFDPAHCKYRKAPLLPVAECSQPRASFIDGYNENLAKLESSIAAVPGVHLLRTFRYFCSATACSMAHHSEVLYRDPNHLNMKGTRYLAKQMLAGSPELREALGLGNSELPTKVQAGSQTSP